MTGLFTAALSFAVVLFRHSVTSHMAGLCLTSAIMIMSDVFLFTRYAAALEKSMVSVERLQESAPKTNTYVRSGAEKIRKKNCLSKVKWNDLIDISPDRSTAT